MITPAFTGQYYQDTSTKKLWKANSTTAGDWTAVGNFNKSGAGDPTGIETPDFTGQTYRDTATGNIWTSTGLTNADWSLTVQDAYLRWTPTNLNLFSFLSFITWSGWTGIVTVDLPSVSTGTDGIDIEGCAELESLSFSKLVQSLTGNLITITDCPLLNSLNLPLYQGTDGIVLKRLDALTSIDIPNLTEVRGLTISDNDTLTSVTANLLASQTSPVLSLSIYTNPLLTNISLPLLGSVAGPLVLNDNALSTLSLPNYIPTNTMEQNLSGNALDLASIDGFLARCVANAAYVNGTIKINGGTNAAPTQGPGSSHDILVARGVVINHN